MAGLNFVGNASYQAAGRIMTTSHSLSSSPDSRQPVRVRERGSHPPRPMVLTDTPFNEQFAPAQLHWILADKMNASSSTDTATDCISTTIRWCPDKQSSAVPAAAVLLNNYMNLVPEAAVEYIFCRSAAYNLQPRHGRSPDFRETSPPLPGLHGSLLQNQMPAPAHPS